MAIGEAGRRTIKEAAKEMHEAGLGDRKVVDEFQVLTNVGGDRIDELLIEDLGESKAPAEKKSPRNSLEKFGIEEKEKNDEIFRAIFKVFDQTKTKLVQELTSLSGSDDDRKKNKRRIADLESSLNRLLRLRNEALDRLGKLEISSTMLSSTDLDRLYQALKVFSLVDENRVLQLGDGGFKSQHLITAEHQLLTAELTRDTKGKLLSMLAGSVIPIGVAALSPQIGGEIRMASRYAGLVPIAIGTISWAAWDIGQLLTQFEKTSAAGDWLVKKSAKVFGDMVGSKWRGRATAAAVGALMGGLVDGYTHTSSNIHSLFEQDDIPAAITTATPEISTATVATATVTAIGTPTEAQPPVGSPGMSIVGSPVENGDGFKAFLIDSDGIEGADFGVGYNPGTGEWQVQEVGGNWQ
ncbi:MAG TPA: hypothetical protein PKX78_03095, partial [Candidatus Woesebacteria bacterium]|nr:hypothetical protein [Candidatus Woesebacteria bacterium]